VRPAAPGARAAAEQQQQLQGSQGGNGRPVDEWMERDTRPRIADALADGVLPSSEDAGGPAAPPAGSSTERVPTTQQEQVV
jgi:hypothetical protein